MRKNESHTALPGYWQPTDEDVKNVHDFLLKGGFMIIDDFRQQHWFNLQDQMKRVLPNAQWLPVEPGSAVSRYNLGIVSLELRPKAEALKQHKKLQALDEKLVRKLYGEIYKDKILDVSSAPR